MESSKASTAGSCCSGFRQNLSNSSRGGRDFSNKMVGMERVQAHTEFAKMQMYKQQAAWWKSQYVAAQYENRMLRTLLDKIYQLPATSANKTRVMKRKKNKKKKTSSHSSYKDLEGIESDESVELEISEEFKQFLDINRQHREERERRKATLKKARGSESESERVERMEQEPKDDENVRQEQLVLLYGEEWKLVEGLETHVQMKYDMFCDRNKPAYWPNIPLNL